MRKDAIVITPIFTYFLTDHAIFMPRAIKQITVGYVSQPNQIFFFLRKIVGLRNPALL